VEVELAQRLGKPKSRIAPDNGHSLPDPSTTAILAGPAILQLLKV
jgi:hypothetical protein